MARKAAPSRGQTQNTTHQCPSPTTGRLRPATNRTNGSKGVAVPMSFCRRVQAFDRQIKAAPMSQTQGSGTMKRASPPISLSPGRNAGVPNRSWASTATALAPLVVVI
jgi:hypothetical protein